MIRRIWWLAVAWRRGVPTCVECGRPKDERPHGWRCRPCWDRWAAGLESKGKPTS